MTDTISLASLTEQLAEAQADLALSHRLKSAQARAKDLIAQCEKAQAEHEAAQVANAKAAQDARFAGLKNLAIVEVADPNGPGLLKNRYRITYTRDAWNGDLNVTLPTPASDNGFEALPSHVYEWIVTRHPEQVPAAIRALDPTGNVEEALARYITARRRGYLSN